MLCIKLYSTIFKNRYNGHGVYKQTISTLVGFTMLKKKIQESVHIWLEIRIWVWILDIKTTDKKRIKIWTKFTITESTSLKYSSKSSIKQHQLTHLKHYLSYNLHTSMDYLRYKKCKKPLLHTSYIFAFSSYRYTTKKRLIK